jgi:hypothetical protein
MDHWETNSGIPNQWRKFTFSGGGAKPPKFPTKLSNFRQTPPFALEKAVFSPLLGQNFRKFVIFVKGGGGGGRRSPTKVSATVPNLDKNEITQLCNKMKNLP